MILILLSCMSCSIVLYVLVPHKKILKNAPCEKLFRKQKMCPNSDHSCI